MSSASAESFISSGIEVSTYTSELRPSYEVPKRVTAPFLLSEFGRGGTNSS